MNFWIGIVFFCTTQQDCYFFKPQQTFDNQKVCFKVVNEYSTKMEEAGALLVKSNCLYIQAGKTVNGKESISKP